MIVINDDDSLRTEQLPPTEADLEFEHEHECALNLQKVFSEKVVDSVVDKVVHKIQKYVQPDVVEVQKIFNRNMALLGMWSILQTYKNL